MQDFTEELCDLMRSRGIIPPANFIADGKIHRFSSNGKPGDDAGWYVIFDGVIVAGAFGCWRLGVQQTWRVSIDRKLTPQEEVANKARLEEIRQASSEEEQARHIEAREKAQSILNSAPAANDTHPYLIRKRVKAHGLHIHDGKLVVPVRDEAGELHSLQFITADGDKRFLPGGRVKGCFHLIGATALAEESLAYVVEGFATGESIHMATGKPVIVVFDAGNLMLVVDAVRKCFSALELVVAGDDDRWKPEATNAGRTKAEAVAQKHGIQVIFPLFKDETATPTDWNDLHIAEGLEAVREQLKFAGDGSESALENDSIHGWILNGKKIGVPFSDGPSNSNRTKQTGYDADQLEHMLFSPIKYIVEGYIPEGVTIFAGKPKLGKSWGCLDIGIAVATGGKVFDSISCEQGDVLYLALEDNPRRLKSRMRKLFGKNKSWPKALRFETQWPRLNEGGVNKIREWIESKANSRLVIIDTLGKVRGQQDKQDSAYQADYKAMTELQTLASEKSLAIVIVHHVRKMEADDPIDTVSGTLGLSGAADTILVLNRNSHGVTLYGRGRDIEEIETVLKFDKATCRWSIVGRVTEVKKSDERAEILKILDDDMKPVKPQEVADLLGKPQTAIRQMMVRMAKAGDIQKVSYGIYASNNYTKDNKSDAMACHSSHTVTDEQEGDNNP